MYCTVLQEEQRDASGEAKEFRNLRVRSFLVSAGDHALDNDMQ